MFLFAVWNGELSNWLHGDWAGENLFVGLMQKGRRNWLQISIWQGHGGAALEQVVRGVLGCLSFDTWIVMGMEKANTQFRGDIAFHSRHQSPVCKFTTLRASAAI